MRRKPDAYALEFSGRPSNIVKCDNCSFKAVLAQFQEEGCCPKCKDDGAETIKGKVQRTGKIKGE